MGKSTVGFCFLEEIVRKHVKFYEEKDKRKNKIYEPPKIMAVWVSSMAIMVQVYPVVN